MRAAIIPANEHEFFTSEQCSIIEYSNSADDPGLSIARARVAPGVTTRWHRLADSGERYFILSGEGVVEVGDLPPQRVSAGDCVIIPPLTRQRIGNCGSDDLIFLALCTPRFRAENYQELESEEKPPPAAASGVAPASRGVKPQ